MNRIDAANRLATLITWIKWVTIGACIIAALGTAIVAGGTQTTTIDPDTGQATDTSGLTAGLGAAVAGGWILTAVWVFVVAGWFGHTLRMSALIALNTTPTQMILTRNSGSSWSASPTTASVPASNLPPKPEHNRPTPAP